MPKQPWDVERQCFRLAFEAQSRTEEKAVELYLAFEAQSETEDWMLQSNMTAARDPKQKNTEKIR